MYFGVYEGLRRAMGVAEGEPAPAWKLLTAGGLAGVAYWSMGYPLDAVKTQMQADHIDPAKRRFKGNALATARAIMATEGARGFVRGITPAMLRSVPANAACFLAFEQTRNALNAMRAERNGVSA